MNYRHIYHAGNFADVYKHCILIMLIQSLCKKEQPYLYLDTHAGIGEYDLTSVIAQKTQEYKTGIECIYQQQDCPEVIKIYQKLIQNHNPQDEKKLHYYPGSPMLVRALLREQDRMVLTELHHDDIKNLQQLFAFDARVSVHYADGYQSIKKFLPPKIGRALTLIDPAYESKSELKQVLDTLKIAKKRCINGIYAIWYPIKNLGAIKHFYQELLYLGFPSVLVSEFSLTADTEIKGLNSCGMVIINPPWQFDNNLKQILPWLHNKLTIDKTGKWSVKWLIHPP